MDKEGAMRQGIIIFADAPAAGSPAEALLKATVEAARSTTGVTPFLAYGKAESSGPLRDLVGGPPPRFFPQAARQTLGERMAQAFAFLFVQDFERVLLVQPGTAAPTAAQLQAMFAGLEGAPVHIDTSADAIMVALRRPDFPQIARIFEDVAWERSGAKESAEKILAEDAAKG